MKHLFAGIAVAFALPVFAAHIGFVMPAGARRGASVELIVGGQAFGGVDDILVSGGGVTAESVEAVASIPHPSSEQRKYLYSWLRGIHRGDPRKPPLPESVSGWRPHPYYDDPVNLSDGERDILYRFLFVPHNSLQASPAINRRVLVRLRVSPNAAPGEREFRLVSHGRISNPLKFYISDLPEVREPYFPMPPAVVRPLRFTVPSVLNGQIMPGESDRYGFTAKKGEVITFGAKARDLMPFIGDGVPGHFQMFMEVLDGDGRTVALADDRYFDPDPELVFTAPKDGEYTLVVRDALYRGREDFVYRIRATAGRPPRRSLAPPELPGVSLTTARHLAGRVVTAPTLVRDILRTPAGNRYRFRGEKSKPVMLEVFARRQGSPADPLLRVRDAQGKLLAVNDDVPRLKAGVILHRDADPCIRFVPPEDGVYTAEVSDLCGASGPEYEYFLRIDRERPRFAVYIIPSAVEVNRNGIGRATLVAERFDGYAGEIELTLRNGDDFFIAGAGSIPAGCDRTAITFGVSNKRRSAPQTPTLIASGGGFRTTAIPGDEMMQAFAYTHIVPARQLLLTGVRTVPGRERFAWADSMERVSLERDATVTAQVNLRGVPADAEAELVMVDPPPWLKARPGSAHRIAKGTIKPAQGKGAPVYQPLSLTLYAAPEGKGKAVNQLFKIIWKYNGRPGKDGKARRFEHQSFLPTVRVEGGGK